MFLENSAHRLKMADHLFGQHVIEKLRGSAFRCLGVLVDVECQTVDIFLPVRAHLCANNSFKVVAPCIENPPRPQRRGRELTKKPPTYQVEEDVAREVHDHPKLHIPNNKGKRSDAVQCRPSLQRWRFSRRRLTLTPSAHIVSALFPQHIHTRVMSRHRRRAATTYPIVLDVDTAAVRMKVRQVVRRRMSTRMQFWNKRPVLWCKITR